MTCPSGRRCNSRKVVCVQAHRGFKSHRYRHEKSLDLQVKGFFILYCRDLGADCVIRRNHCNRSDNPRFPPIPPHKKPRPFGQSFFNLDLYRVFSELTTLVKESLASPKSSEVFGSNNTSFSMPAKPGRIERFKKTTCWA